MTTTIIAAIGAGNELGKDNELIWHLPADLKRFKRITTGHYVIMGRNTFESIGKPLPNRTNIIITHNLSYTQPGCIVVHSIEEAIEVAKGQDTVFIAGGAKIYRESIEKDLVDILDITHIHQKFDADVFFPEIDQNIWEIVTKENFKADKKNLYDYSFVRYKKSS